MSCSKDADLPGASVWVLVVAAFSPWIANSSATVWAASDWFITLVCTWDGVRVRRGDEGGPLFQMHGVSDNQADMAVDAGPGVPARGRLPRVVGADGEHILRLQMAGKFISKADVPIRAFAERETIDPNFTIRHHAIEFDVDATAGVGGSEREVLAIPADSSGQIAATLAGEILFVEGTFDGPIVRDGDSTPRGIGEIRRFGAGLIGFEETPVGIEGLNDTRHGGSGHRRPAGGRQRYAFQADYGTPHGGAGRDWSHAPLFVIAKRELGLGKKLRALY